MTGLPQRVCSSVPRITLVRRLLTERQTLSSPGTASRSAVTSASGCGIFALVTTSTTISPPDRVERVMMWRTRPRPVISS